MPRFVEIESGKVMYVLPPELAADYPVLVWNQVAIPLDADVVQGDIYKDGKFRHITVAEIQVQARPAFNVQRNDLFDQTRWARERHSDMKDLAIDDKTNWTAWLNYWQALRNMPQQLKFDPANPSWPVQPQ